MRHFLFGAQQYLLTDDLGNAELFRFITDDILGIERIAFRQILYRCIEKIRKVLLRQCGDRKVFRKVKTFLPCCQLIDDLFLVHRIDLVQKQKCRQLGL